MTPYFSKYGNYLSMEAPTFKLWVLEPFYGKYSKITHFGGGEGSEVGLWDQKKFEKWRMTETGGFREQYEEGEETGGGGTWRETFWWRG